MAISRQKSTSAADTLNSKPGPGENCEKGESQGKGAFHGFNGWVGERQGAGSLAPSPFGPQSLSETPASSKVENASADSFLMNSRSFSLAERKI